MNVIWRGASVGNALLTIHHIINNQALETYRISYLLFFRTCVTLFRLRPELQPSDTIYGHIHRNSIFHTTFKD